MGGEQSQAILSLLRNNTPAFSDMFGQCHGLVWRLDDFTTCVQHESVFASPPVKLKA